MNEGVYLIFGLLPYQRRSALAEVMVYVKIKFQLVRGVVVIQDRREEFFSDWKEDMVRLPLG